MLLVLHPGENIFPVFVFPPTGKITRLHFDRMAVQYKYMINACIQKIPVMGLPGCVMYAKRTVLDLVLPRIMTGEVLEKADLDRLGEGGLCLSCPVCTFPNCGFGK